LSTSKEGAEKNRLERVKKNDPVAIRVMGKKHYRRGDHENAFKYWTRAAGLGDAEAHFNLSVMYYKGEGVDRDEKKQVYHLEEAAIGGHPAARHNIGVLEETNGRFGRARKHWIIATNLGFNDSLKLLRKLYADGHASKEDYADTLRAYQAAVDAMKSSERERAEEAIKKGEASYSI
jgi:TPR repeat protein